MAINFTDFSQAKLLDSPFKNIIEDAFKGYSMSQIPKEIKQEQQKKELANQLSKLDLEHKPTEYALGDKNKSLANALSSKALEHYEEKYALDRDYKKALIEKALRAGTTGGSALKPNAAVANAEYIWQLQHPPGTPSTPEQEKEHLDYLQKAFKTGQEHIAKGTERTQVLNDTQYNRGLTQIGKAYDELRFIDAGKFPGTNDPISPMNQAMMKSALLLKISKDTTDPKTRERLINASNMNITLDSVDAERLTQYSGAKGQVKKLGDVIKNTAGSGSADYASYISEVVKANAAAKQLRQYLGDSIQPTAQLRLDKLTNPEAWNVTPQQAKENFEFMRDLFKRETQTLVRGMTDPSLYTAAGNAASPTEQGAGTMPGFDFSSYPVAGGR